MSLQSRDWPCGQFDPPADDQSLQAQQEYALSLHNCQIAFTRLLGAHTSLLHTEHISENYERPVFWTGFMRTAHIDRPADDQLTEAQREYALSLHDCQIAP